MASHAVGGIGCQRVCYKALFVEGDTPASLHRIFLEEGFSEEAVTDLERRGHLVCAGECNHDRVRSIMMIYCAASEARA